MCLSFDTSPYFFLFPFGTQLAIAPQKAEKNPQNQLSEIFGQVGNATKKPTKTCDFSGFLT